MLVSSLEAIKLDPKNTELLVERASCLLANHEPDKALPDLKEVPESQRKARVIGLEGQAYFMLNQKDKAKACLDRLNKSAGQLGPIDIPAVTNLGNMLSGKWKAQTNPARFIWLVRRNHSR